MANPNTLVSTIEETDDMFPDHLTTPEEMAANAVRHQKWEIDKRLTNLALAVQSVQCIHPGDLISKHFVVIRDAVVILNALFNDYGYDYDDWRKVLVDIKEDIATHATTYGARR